MKFMWFFSMAIACLIGSCTKEKSVPNTGSFIKTYDSDSVDNAIYVAQTNDEGYLILANHGSGRPMLLRTDKAGNLIKRTIVDRYIFNTNAGTYWWFNPMDGTHFILQQGGNVSDIDTAGNILYYNYISYWTMTNMSAIVPVGNGYVLPATDGYRNGGPGNNEMILLNKNLKINLGGFAMNDNLFGGKILYYFCYGGNSDGSYNIWGMKFLNNKWSWSDNTRLFMAKVIPNVKVTQVLIDSAETKTSDNVNWQTVTPDSGVIALSVRTDNSKNYNYPFIFKADKNQHLLWENSFPKPGFTIDPINVHYCSDGSTIMLGNILALGDLDNKPYVLKIDKSGNKVWDKTIDCPSRGALFNAIETKDGGLALIGNTTGFGNASRGSRTLFIKLDGNGN